MEVFEAINVAHSAVGTVSELNDIRCSRVARTHLGQETFYPYLVAEPDPRLEWSSGFMTNCHCGRMFVKKTMSEGTFMCPLCHEEQHYKLKEVWLKCHWYWVIRCCGEKLVEYAKCKKCGFHYQPDVALEWSTSKTKKALDDAKLHAMVSMALASDNGISKVVKAQIQRDYESLTKNKPTGTVETSFAQVLECSKTGHVKAELQRFAPFLSGLQKDDIIKSMISIAIEYGDSLDRAQATLLAEVANVLDVPNAHTKELFSVTRHSESEAIRHLNAVAVQASGKAQESTYQVQGLPQQHAESVPPTVVEEEVIVRSSHIRRPQSPIIKQKETDMECFA